jgi:CBS domain-containing protein
MQTTLQPTLQAQDVMTEGLALCTPDTPLADVASLMVRYDCGAIPVVEDFRSQRLVGIVTDRDITCRTLAEGLDPVGMTAGQVMSQPVITATPGTGFRECVARMEQAQVRRLPVVDDEGRILGIIAQADVASTNPGPRTGAMVERISEPGFADAARSI